MIRLLFIIGLSVMLFGTAFIPPTPLGAFNADSLSPLPARIVAYVQSHVGTEEKTPRTRPIYDIKDPDLVAPLQSVEWAIKRRDLRACNRIPPHERRSDLLTMCVSVVQKDLKRCQVISTKRLEKLCHDLNAA